MSEAQRLVLLGLVFGLIVVMLGFAETWMIGDRGLLRPWLRRLPEGVAIVIVATLLGAAAGGVIGSTGATYVVLAGCTVALYRLRLPEARRSLTPSRAIVLLLGAVGAMVFLGLLVGAIAGAPPA